MRKMDMDSQWQVQGAELLVPDDLPVKISADHELFHLQSFHSWLAALLVVVHCDKSEDECSLLNPVLVPQLRFQTLKEH